MTDDRDPLRGPGEFAAVDPYALSRRETASTQIKRSYRQATVSKAEDGFAVMLDGRAVKTPARAELVLPSRQAAEAVAEEWNQQGDILRPMDMVLTRLVNTVIDGVARSMTDVRAEVVKYAGSDLLCYRADRPAELAALQAQEWDPVVDWAENRLGAKFLVTEGVVFVTQLPLTLEAIDRAVFDAAGAGANAAFRLGALHVMTALTGSALLALAVLLGRFEPGDGWRKAHVDEDYQLGQWGEDEEAAIRRHRRWLDMEAAANLARMLDMQHG